jgi:hypothetical protein
MIMMGFARPDAGTATPHGKTGTLSSKPMIVYGLIVDWVRIG